MEQVGKVMIDGILEVIEVIMASSMTMEIVIGREVRLADRTLINLHFAELAQNGNPSKMRSTKMHLLQVCIQLGKRHHRVS